MNNTSKSWYVLYTRPRHEKKICLYLKQENIESFLPMTYVIRQWSDRKKQIRVPLFPSYVFVHLEPNQFWTANDLPGAIRYIGIGQKPSPVPDSVIESLRKVENKIVKVDDLSLHKGEKIRIMDGEFAGVEGSFIRKGSKNMLAIEVEIMNRVVVVELQSNHVRQLQTC